jgi:hypothetical protein
MRIYHELTNGVLSGESVTRYTAPIEHVMFSVKCEFHSNKCDYRVTLYRSDLCRSSAIDYTRIINMEQGPRVVTGINLKRNFDDYR